MGLYLLFPFVQVLVYWIIFMHYECVCVCVYRCVVTWRYWVDKCRTFLTTQKMGTLWTFLFPKFMASGMKKKAQWQGIGHHSPEEIYLICRKDCATLASILGMYDELKQKPL